MTPSIRKTIHTLYRSSEEARLIALLDRCGSGITHARSAIRYDLILRAAAGDVNTVESLVTLACASPAKFDRYMDRFEAWQSVIETYRSDPRSYIHDAAEIIARIAPRVAEHACGLSLSVSVVCLHSEDQSRPDVVDLQIVPVVDGGLWVSSDRDAREMPRTIEALKPSTGRFTRNEIDPGQIIVEEIARAFERDIRIE